jgi:hypothetical protein
MNFILADMHGLMLIHNPVLQRYLSLPSYLLHFTWALRWLLAKSNFFQSCTLVLIVSAVLQLMFHVRDARKNHEWWGRWTCMMYLESWMGTWLASRITTRKVYSWHWSKHLTSCNPDLQFWLGNSIMDCVWLPVNQDSFVLDIVGVSSASVIVDMWFSIM